MYAEIVARSKQMTRYGSRNHMIALTKCKFKLDLKCY